MNKSDVIEFFDRCARNEQGAAVPPSQRGGTKYFH